MAYDRTEPHDDEGFFILNNFNQFISAARARPGHVYLSEFAEEKLDEMSDYGRLTRGMLERFQKKVFVKIDQEKKVIFFAQFKLSPRGSIRRMDYTEVKSLELRWRSTPRGLVYLVNPKNLPMYLMFYSHFFDRFVERGLGEESATRLQAIGHFLWKTLDREDNRLLVLKQDRGALLYTREGTGLGFLRVLTNRAQFRPATILLMKTYVSRDMMTEKQRALEGLAGELPRLPYDHLKE